MDEKENQRRFSAANFTAAHADHIKEYPSARFYVDRNGPLVRIAFGQSEVRDEDGTLTAAPRYHVAVSMPPSQAVILRDVLLKLFPIMPPDGPSQDGAGSGPVIGAGQSRQKKRMS
jgi:hypothetical protein